ncbi:hypothetical protein CK203_044638 [Vitis vinifera]|uniref:Uncharacterized protein n=1 Tax=Vitis vinifera TaxID=29760 RepID=A0A438HJJ3_VITVI|nr:hypothetical protein CK203_044638 [Vitis vinifera]
MERMDHFQTQQDQQTLILREIQQHLGLVPPAPPVAVPSQLQRGPLLSTRGAYYLIIRSLLSFFLFGSLRQVKQRRKAKRSKVKKNQRTAAAVFFALLEHFPKSIFTCYIPFQSSGSQESNASNRVRFGAETRKIWPSEDNCSRFVDNVNDLRSHELSDSCPIGVSVDSCPASAP